MRGGAGRSIGLLQGAPPERGRLQTSSTSKRNAPKIPLQAVRQKKRMRASSLRRPCGSVRSRRNATSFQRELAQRELLEISNFLIGRHGSPPGERQMSGFAGAFA